MKTISFIGGGRITRILLKGFKNAGVKFEFIKVFETNTDVSAVLKKDFPEVQLFETDLQQVVSAELVIVALHPPKVLEILQSVSSSVGENSLIISLAPKITIKQIKNSLSGNKKVIRMIPNAGSYVNKGYNPVSFATEVDDETRNKIITLFENLGKVPVVNENQLEGFAMICAMGHTYFWFQIRHLKELAVKFAIPEEIVNESIDEMLRGTVETLFNSGLTYEQVVDLVPVRPIAGSEQQIKEILSENLVTVYNKINPE